MTMAIMTDTKCEACQSRKIETSCRRAEGQKAEEEERLRELGYSVAGQKIRKKSVADFKKYCGRLWQDLDFVCSRLA